MASIRQGIDYLGLNYYNSDLWRFDPEGWAPYEASRVKPPAAALKQTDWQPDGLRRMLLGIHERYGQPEIIVTENGLAAEDFVDHRGEVNDEARIEYIYSHLAACRRSLDEGVKLRGYFVWSFLDDYEWGSFGRMGLVHVDFSSLRRRMKRSGRWFAACIASRRFSLP